MKFGLEDKHWDFIQKILVTPLKEHGAKVWVFGSRSTGTYKKFSDLDVLYLESNELPKNFVFKINEELENSDLSIKVDIVNMADLAEGYKSNILNQLQEL